MTMISLPLIGKARTEFGYSRTVCSCHDCINCCRNIPGYLVPADLDRIHAYLAPGEDLLVWARKHLLASPGALVSRAGSVFRIPTLVPSRDANGACHFLTPEDRCSVHSVSPFGCAFFDTHMNSDEADARSTAGLRAVLESWMARGPYAEVWLYLATKGLTSPPPEVSRARLKQLEHSGKTV